MTIISDSPLLEHDAMYMSQLISKSRHRQLERKAREQRRRELALKSGMSPEELEIREKEAAEKRRNAEGNAPIQMFDEIDIDPRKILDTKTVAKLKELCKEKELPVSGKKNDLIKRFYVIMMEEKEIQQLLDTIESRIDSLAKRQTEIEDIIGFNKVLSAYISERDTYSEHLSKMKELIIRFGSNDESLQYGVDPDFPVEAAIDEDLLDYLSELTSFEDEELLDDEDICLRFLD